jgi:hypothetical protein
VLYSPLGGDGVEVNRAIILQVSMMYYLVNRWKKSFNEFFELDKKYSILRLIRDSYEPFHLTGEEGIAIEIENHIKQCGGFV